MKIECRAFSKKFGMVYPDHPDIRIDVHAQSCWHDARCDEGVHLMLCTQRKDRHGNMIWVDDVLRIAYEQAGHPMTGDGEDSGYYIGRVHLTPSKGFVLKDVLKYSDNADEGAPPEKLDRNGLSYITASSSTNLGNIHENPGLMEAAA